MGGNTKREVVMDPLTGVSFHTPSYPLPEGDLIEVACSCLGRLTHKINIGFIHIRKRRKKPPILFFDAFKCLLEMERG
jgi:hypothetical protein